MTQFTPRSLSCATASSPVNAPAPPFHTFCAATATSGCLSSACTCVKYSAGGATTTVVPDGTAPSPVSSAHSLATAARVAG